MNISDNKKMIDVAIIPHPFAAERIHHKIPLGYTIAETINRLQPDEKLSQHAHVYLDGGYIPKIQWQHIKPKHGSVLSIRMIPMGGGGGKNPLRTVLSLAVMIGAQQFSFGLSGAFGSSSFLGINLGRGLAVGANLLGRLALNALAPPPKARFKREKESLTFFLQGARNEIVPFGRVPKVLGKHRFVPPLGARPYTETIGNDQYIRMLFIWGYGPLQISDLKIGETPLSEFEGVEIETREGYNTDSPITLYSNSVLQNDLQINLTSAAGYVLRTTDTDAEEISVDITLPRGLFKFNSAGDKITSSIQLEVQYSVKDQNVWSAGSDTYKAISGQTQGSITKPAAYVYQSISYVVTRIDRLVLDPASGVITYIQGTSFREGIDVGSAVAPAIPSGLLSVAKIERRSDDASVIPSARITDERDSSLFGSVFQTSGDFLVTPNAGVNTVDIAAGGLKYSAINITGKQSSAIRKSVSFKVPKGQYDVRVKRITADSTDDNTFDETVWTALRTIRYVEPVAMEGLAMTALRIKATDQLNGVIDRLNGVVHSILPDWNGSSWAEQVTSNPASIFRHILQGAANARPLADNRIDISKLETWHDNCAADNREFNSVIDYDVSVKDILQDVAATGRANPSLVDGKWGIVEDLEQSVPIQHFTPRNSFQFKGEKAFDEIPDALRVHFINRDKGWLQDEVLVFDDGFDEESAQNYETLELPGITSADQAWKDGRYHLATARLRPETYSFYADIEHIVCTRGDMIRFTHDVPIFGLMSGRVKSLTTSGSDITAVTLDAGMPMEAGKSYAVRFRKSDGSSLVVAVDTEAGTVLDLTLTTPIAIATGPEVGDLVLFGESGQESVRLIVKSIEPQSDLNARITCVDADPAIHAAPLATMPVFTSSLTGEGVIQRPPVPVLSQIQSGLESMMKNTDGSLTSRIIITLEPPLFGRVLDIQAKIKAKDETEYRTAEIITQGLNKLSITDITEGETYDIQLRYTTHDDILSPALEILSHRVEGATALPSNVSNFNMNVLGTVAHLSWDSISDIDLSHYVLRYTPQTTSVTWGGASDIISKISKDATSVSLPAAMGTYLLKAVDVGGRQSENAVLVVSTIAGLLGYNAVLNVTEDTSFLGSKTNLGVAGSALQISGADTIDDWTDIDTVLNIDIGNAGIASSGSYLFNTDVDLGAVYTSRLTADMNVLGLDMSTTLDAWSDVDGQESWDQSVDPSLWNVQLQLRTTDDDPAATPTWSNWMNFVVGDYSARGFQFKTLLTSGSQTITPSISRLRVDIDMPDSVLSDRNITSLAAGSAVSFSKTFRATPAISITAQNMATGDYYTITSISKTGFTVQFFNSSDVGIVRVFDYLAKGYGAEI